MFQQNIEISKPHYKPTVFKSAIDNETSGEDSVMTLEYFATYELELQETILQLNSELDRDSQDSDFEEEDAFVVSESQCDDRPSDSESSSTEELETFNEVHENSSGHQQESNERVNEFGNYEQRLQNAVHELTSLSDILVRRFTI